MWVYEQKTGKMFRRVDGIGVEFTGYAGKDEFKNDPDAETLKNLGPIPRGVYRIGDPHDSPQRGPFCLPLTPDAANQMHGRYAFLIHGDSVKAPGTASEGCIILSRAAREAIAASGDRELRVIAGVENETVH